MEILGPVLDDATINLHSYDSSTTERAWCGNRDQEECSSYLTTRSRQPLEVFRPGSVLAS